MNSTQARGRPQRKWGLIGIGEYTEYFYTYDLVEHLGQLAWYNFVRKDYEKSVHYFEQLFKQQEEHPNDTYHVAAEAWAALKNKDKTLTYLRAAGEHGWKHLDYTMQVEAIDQSISIPPKPKKVLKFE